MTPIQAVDGELRKNSLGVSLWGFFAGNMAQINNPISPFQMFISTVGQITVLLSFLIAAITLFVKVRELVIKYKKKKANERSSISEDSVRATPSNKG